MWNFNAPKVRNGYTSLFDFWKPCKLPHLERIKKKQTKNTLLLVLDEVNKTSYRICQIDKGNVMDARSDIMKFALVFF